MLGRPPKTSIFGHLKVKADQLSHGGDMAGQLTHLSMKQHQIHASLVQACYISKFLPKSKKKMCWKSGETVTSLGTGQNILLNC